MDDLNKLTAHDDSMAAILRKTTSPAPAQKRGQREQGGVTPNRGELIGLASSRIRAIRNAEKIFDALPELETIVTISTSSLLSTKDLVTTSLVYDCLDSEIPLDLRNNFLRVVRDFFNDEDELPRNLYEWLYDAQRSKGATPILITSDSGFDEMFNLDEKVATESFRSKLKNTFEAQLGILRNINPDRKLMGLESILNTSTVSGPQEFKLDLSKMFKDDSDFHTQKLVITDNPQVTQLSTFRRRLARESARGALRKQMGVPSYNDGSGGISGPQGDLLEGQTDESKLISGKDLNPQYDRQFEHKPYKEAPLIEFGQKNKLEPIRRRVPPECALPVVLAGDVRNPIGWLLILDDIGNFVSAKSSIYGDASFMNYLTNDGMMDSIVNRASINMGNQQGVNPDIANRLVSRYGELAEDQMNRMISTALGGGDVSVNITEDFGRVMFGRHLAKEHTQILYVPYENMPYFATDFNEDGIGVSITERSFVISTIRMSLLFAGMNTAILNSARHMQFDIELSPDDMNPQETIDRLKSDIINSHNRKMPQWGDMNDTFANATNAGMAFNVQGNDHYGSHRVSVSDTTPDYKEPDAELDDKLLRRTCAIAGVDPDLVLTPENLEFASQIYSKSLITTQQVTKKQEQLSKPITLYVQTMSMASPGVMADLLKEAVDYVKTQKPDTNIEELMPEISGSVQSFIDAIKVTLPPPDTSAASSQMEQYDKRVEFIEELSNSVMTDDLAALLSENGIAMDPDQLKSLVKNYYLRTWLKNNGIENDFFDLFYNTENRQDIIKAITDDTKNTAELFLMLAKKVTGKVETAAKAKGGENQADGAGFDSNGNDTSFVENTDDDNAGGEGGGDDDWTDDNNDGGGDGTDGDGTGDGTGDTTDDVTGDGAGDGTGDGDGTDGGDGLDDDMKF
ncbi:putative virion structural protein [Erwinia phage vB_EamM_Phobos]|uniref:virion structural protein n=1 Tax=Erwinia phage vB_EamM_Phobos TaxID=1883377 RepID=UPI00081CAC0A|nr:virion structural protein [Erwinia phage vB_EamM_Phobos]ANZ50268.1 putative virion structural protein [Erwinia phage vB_EamM_Phobos]